MKTYRFFFVEDPDDVSKAEVGQVVKGRTQTAKVPDGAVSDMVDSAITAHPMTVDPWGRHIVTNPFLFTELVKQIVTASKLMKAGQ